MNKGLNFIIVILLILGIGLSTTACKKKISRKQTGIILKNEFYNNWLTSKKIEPKDLDFIYKSIKDFEKPKN